MTKVGVVQNTFHLNGDLIISVDIEEKAGTSIKIGDIVRFEKLGEMPISGLKFWTDHKKIDFLITDDFGEPEIGEAVYI